MRRQNWLILLILFALADVMLLVALLFNFFAPAAGASIPATLAFATYQAGEIAPTATLEPSPALAPTDAPPPTETQAITYSYTVVSGDTLWDIARRFNVTMETLVEANPNLNPDQLYPGDVLVVPAIFGLVETLTPSTTPTDGPISPTPTVLPTETPTPTVTPTLAGPVMAQVSAQGGGLRFRQSPGTAGQILSFLDALTPMTLLGRTGDNVWAQVIVPGSDQGWVMVRWLDVFVNLSDLPVSGIPVDATATVPPPTRAPTAIPPTRTPKPPTAVAAPSTSPASPVPQLPTDVPTLPPPTVTEIPPPPVPTPAPTQVPIYPYISGISEHAHQIFLQGQGRGNRANVFSKIGDSITVSAVFLNPIAAGNYQLHDYNYLQSVVDYYSSAWARTGNSFGNTSLAAKVGWTAGAALNPANADAANCLSGESPLVCEYRVVKPTAAIIMLGTNDVPGTPASAFEANMRRVIEATLSMGVIPVVSTIPPMHRAGTEGRVELLNGIIIALAHEYDVPLLDYESALQGLPNDGLGSDGVHPSWAPSGNSANFTQEYLQYGMTVRNLTALWALDAVWKFALHP